MYLARYVGGAKIDEIQNPNETKKYWVLSDSVQNQTKPISSLTPAHFTIINLISLFLNSLPKKRNPSCQPHPTPSFLVVAKIDINCRSHLSSISLFVIV